MQQNLTQQLRPTEPKVKASKPHSLPTAGIDYAVKPDKLTLSTTECTACNPIDSAKRQAPINKTPKMPSNTIVEPRTADKEFFNFAVDKILNSPSPASSNKPQDKLDCHEATPVSEPQPLDFQPVIDHRRNVVQLNGLREVNLLDPFKKKDRARQFEGKPL